MSEVMAGLLLPRDPAILDMFRAALPAGWTAIVGRAGADAPEFAEALPRLEYIVAYGNRLERRHIERATRLKMIQKVGVGVDDLDMEACRERGIRVAICPVGSTEAVAEQALSLMLAGLKRLIDLDRSVRQDREWDRWRFRPLIRQLSGSTVGVIGHGAIGSAVAARLRAFGARVLVYARRPLDLSASSGLEQCPSLEQLFDDASVVTLHVPLSNRTRKMVGENLLMRLGPQGLLVNTARGEIVDERALARLLADGRLGFAALDVLSAEPPAPDNPLLSLPNVLLTPHVGGGGLDVLRLKAAFVADNLKTHAAGGAIRSALA
jgi:phosphoglycerate dehydrogenase-like enzyme